MRLSDCCSHPPSTSVIHSSEGRQVVVATEHCYHSQLCPAGRAFLAGLSLSIASCAAGKGIDVGVVLGGTVGACGVLVFASLLVRGTRVRVLSLGSLCLGDGALFFVLAARFVVDASHNRPLIHNIAVPTSLPFFFFYFATFARLSGVLEVDARNELGMWKIELIRAEASIGCFF
eukprot:2382082-Rhodomonas_salina.1